ncbi:MAG: SusF/SusE family outer membrane protein [Bacteroidales bacterium]|nr:SusF/SusE family outer membrane protein [Bacteroidales bacterium]
MKLRYISAVLFASVMFFQACDEDRDSNPVFSEANGFVLNAPAVGNNTYDLENSKNLILTTSQPDYGFTASTVYTVYASLDGTDFKPLSVTSTKAKIEVSASELNSVLLEQAGDADLSEPKPVYVKLSAHIYGDDPDLGLCESNTITLPNVKMYVPKVDVVLPTDLYIVGSFPASGWSNFIQMHEAYSQEGFFYGIVYLENGSNFKMSLKPGWGTDFGFSGMAFDGDLAAASTSSDDGNAIFNGPTGWYTVVTKAKIANGSVQYTVSFRETVIYLIGAATGFSDWGFIDGGQFTAPASADAEWTSPVFAGSGEIRMGVDCGIDWWKTEFTLDGSDNIFYRNCDIPANWAENVGADYSKTAAAGGHIYLNFTTGKGRIE